MNKRSKILLKLTILPVMAIFPVVIIAACASQVVVEKGDTAQINYEGTHNGKLFDGGSNWGQTPTNLVIGSNGFVPGFEDQLIGKREGQTVYINLTFPNPYTQSMEKSGWKVEFKVKIIKVVKKVKP